VKTGKLSTHPLLADFRKKGWTTVTTVFANENGEPTQGMPAATATAGSLRSNRMSKRCWRP